MAVTRHIFLLAIALFLAAIATGCRRTVPAELTESDLIGTWQIVRWESGNADFQDYDMMRDLIFSIDREYIRVDCDYSFMGLPSQAWGILSREALPRVQFYLRTHLISDGWMILDAVAEGDHMLGRGGWQSGWGRDPALYDDWIWEAVRKK